MRKNIMPKDVMLLQFFLSQEPNTFIHEVGIDKNGDVVCSCSIWSSKGSCKHSVFVISNMEEDGDYLAELLGDFTDEELAESMTSEENYRKFIVKYGKIEAI